MMSLIHPKVALFDMDGTLINNYTYHLQAWQIICKKYDAPRSLDEIIKDLHGTNFEVCQNFFGKDITFEESTRIGNEKEALYRKIYSPHIKPVEGLIPLLEFFKERKIPMAVGTMGNRENADFTLDHLGIRDFFKVICTAEDVEKGKPDPAIFLKCLNSLNSIPLKVQELWIFEDTSSGIAAAVNAGGTAFGILTSKSEEDLSACGATYCAKNYEEILKLIS